MKKETKGKSWNAVHIECDCQSDEMLVADEKGEDCNAYDLMEKNKQESPICELCGSRNRFDVTFIKEL